MNTHPIGQHLDSCSGPENCSEYLAVLSMTPEQLACYINDSAARFAGRRNATHRVRESEESDCEPPDTYGLRKMRTASVDVALGDCEPPDTYGLAKKEQR